MNFVVPPTLVALAVLASALAGTGCSSTCNTSDDVVPEDYHGGTVANGFYSSSSAHEKLLPFRGGKRYDLYHGLGFEPILVQLYWSFTETGIGTDAQTKDVSSLALAAGNSALIQLKNEAFIRVKNDSCAEFWLLAVASGDPRPADAAQPEDASGE